jgi:hypothetical protein
MSQTSLFLESTGSCENFNGLEGEEEQYRCGESGWMPRKISKQFSIAYVTFF